MDTLTSSQSDLLQAAFGTDALAIAAWRRWRDGIDWEAHLRRNEFRLMPSVGRNLRRLAVDDPLIPRFAGIARQAWYANQFRLRRYQPVLRALVDAGARLAPLPPDWLLLHDGSAMPEREGPLACAMRLSSVDAVTRCLRRSGWRPCAPLPRWPLGGYAFAECEFAWEDARMPSLALALAWQRDAGEPDGRFPEEAWARARPARLANVPVLALSAADAIHQLCRQPPTGDAFASAVDLLLHLDMAKSVSDKPDVAGFEARAPVDAGWHRTFDALRAMLPSLAGPDAKHVAPSRDARSPSAPANRGLRARIAEHWSVYRRAWGSDYSLPAAVRRLPGYLMARWQLTTPRQLPMRAWRGLRFEWRDSRRGADGRGESADR